MFLRGLDALSTEDSVLNCLMRLTQLPIKSIRIGRDPLTQTSRGVCYVEMNSVVDAMFLHNQLLGEPPTIDDKLVSITFGLSWKLNRLFAKFFSYDCSFKFHLYTIVLFRQVLAIIKAHSRLKKEKNPHIQLRLVQQWQLHNGAIKDKNQTKN